MSVTILRVFALLWAFCLLTVGRVEGQEKSTNKDLRLKHLIALAQSLQVEKDEVECTLVESPLLRYKNPLFEAQSDGCMFMWTHEDQPVAFASFSIRHEREVWIELVSFSEEPLRCSNKEMVLWTPAKLGYGPKLFPDAPKPSNSARIRLLHMKRLAEKVASMGNRLLPTPLHRYESPKAGVIDGAVFTLVTANDPEILVAVEAVEKNEKGEEGGGIQYQYKLGTMSSSPRMIKLSGEEVWEVPGYWENPRTRGDFYIERELAKLPEELQAKAISQSNAAASGEIGTSEEVDAPGDSLQDSSQEDLN